MNKIIYAIEIANLYYGGLRILNVKIGQTSDIKSTLRQYRRSNPEVKLLDLWEINPLIEDPYKCEKGIHKLAERYAYDRKGEKFIFLQDNYQEFTENVSLLLRHKTDNIERGRKIKRSRKRKVKGIDYTKKKPMLVKFRGKEHEANTWREIICKISEEIYKDKKDLTPALKIKGRERIYFSKNSRDLVDPQKIKGTPYFCEGNLNANHIVRIVRMLLDIFGYNQQDLEIISR